MQRSTDRIITTHVGSLPRAADWLAMLLDHEQGKPVDGRLYAERERRAVAEIVQQQAATGIDVVSDGEQSKVGFIAYVGHRLAGLKLGGPRESPWALSREVAAFPEYYGAQDAERGGNWGTEILCEEPIAYTGQALIARDIANLKTALHGSAGHGQKVVEAFLPSVSASDIEGWVRNRYYKDREAFIFAAAEAMRHEYLAIHEAGLILQVDEPRMATHFCSTGESLEESRKFAEMCVEALNHALRGIPEDRIRMHTCYGINMGPRIWDMEMKDFVDIMLKVKAGAYSFEYGNPRHEHEWEIWESVKLPDGKILIPGVISHTTMLVEHPQLIAQWLVRFAGIVGRENVIAGSDCGFATQATSHEIHPSIVWAKMRALVEGARIASQKLWS